MSWGDVVKEGTAWPTIHIFVPAIVGIYTQNIWKLLSIIYLFESFEFLISQMPGFGYWAEISLADGLVCDIIMGLLGYASIKILDITVPKKAPKGAFLHHAKFNNTWYSVVVPFLHVFLLSGPTITFQYFPEDSHWDFVAFGTWYTIMAFVFGFGRWASFSALNILIISVIASFIGYTPLVSLGSVFLSTAAFYYYNKKATRKHQSVGTTAGDGGPVSLTF